MAIDKHKIMCFNCKYLLADTLCIKRPTKQEFRGFFTSLKCYKNRYRFFEKKGKWNAKID